MSIQSGDLVKITTKNSMHEGKTGKVVHVFEDEQTVTVSFEQKVAGSVFTSAGSIVSGFFVSELAVLKGVDEDEQIEKLAVVLVEEGRLPSQAYALDAARGLYRAGVRYHGE